MRSITSNSCAAKYYIAIICLVCGVVQSTGLSGCGLRKEHKTQPTWEYVEHITKDLSITIPRVSNVLYVTRIDSLTDNYILLVAECSDKYVYSVLNSFSIDNTGRFNREVISADNLASLIRRDNISEHFSSLQCVSVSVFRTTAASRSGESPWDITIYVASISNGQCKNICARSSSI